MAPTLCVHVCMCLCAYIIVIAVHEKGRAHTSGEKETIHKKSKHNIIVNQKMSVQQ